MRPVAASLRERLGRPPGLDAIVVPALLLLLGRGLLLHDPARVLAWRLLHEPRLAALPSWAAALVPQPGPAVDRDPVSLVLGSAAVLFALLYLALGLAGARARVRAALLGLAAAVLVVLPTAAFVAMGFLTERPYGQDGGVVQLPLAIEKILRGESPYAADYSQSILGRQARVSDFWSERGGNPILRHHAYLPGTHLLMLPAYLALRPAGLFDPREVTLLAWAAAALLAAALARQGSPGPAAADRALAAAALVAFNPFLYWQQVFGANDVVLLACLIGAALLAARGRATAAGALVGLACATKQLAWPFAPFLLLHLSGARSLADVRRGETWRRLLRPLAAAGLVFAVVVLPVAALDFRRFYADIVGYNVGLPGGDNYPLGGTPGWGFANFLIYFGRVHSLKDYFPFGVFYVLLAPLGVMLVLRQMRSGRLSTALVSGSVALLASVYLSRVVHSNYLILASVLLPLAWLLGEDREVDVAAAPLLLLGFAVEVGEEELFRRVWEDAVAARWPEHVAGLGAHLLPRATAELTLDPLGAALSAVAAGLGLLYLVAGVLGAGRRARALIAAAALIALVLAPAVLVMRVGEATGTPRAQDSWFETLSSAARQAAGRSTPAPAQQAWPDSFRRDPPRALEADAALPAEALLARGLGLLARPDPRWLSLAGVTLLAVALAARPAALMVLAGAATAVGVAFGSGDVLLLALLLAAACLRERTPLVASLSLAAAVAFFPRAVFVAPVLLAGSAARAWLPAGLAMAASLAVPGRSYLDALLGHGPPRAGVGFDTWRLYFGHADPSPAEGLALAGLFAFALRLIPALAAAAAAPRLRLAALLLLAALWWTPGSSPHDLLAPAALLVLSAPPEGEAATR